MALTAGAARESRGFWCQLGLGLSPASTMQWKSFGECLIYVSVLFPRG